MEHKEKDKFGQEPEGKVKPPKERSHFGKLDTTSSLQDFGITFVDPVSVLNILIEHAHQI